MDTEKPDIPEMSLELMSKLTRLADDALAANKSIDSILKNHLPHLQHGIDKMNDRLFWLLGLGFAAVVSLVVAVLME